jgi:formylglycine-generating enzyme required for sulfatase activity
MWTRSVLMRTALLVGVLAVPCWLAVCLASDSGSPKSGKAGEAAVPAREIALDLGKSISMKLVLIPAGKFMMGAPDSERAALSKSGKGAAGAPHEVTLSKPFYMGVTEVTQGQYEALLGANPSKVKGATNPVESVSWIEATEFCKKLSEKTGKAVRLPTEAEWEYACRAGTKTRFFFGDSEKGLADYAWFDENSDKAPHPVGQKKPNAWGLYDMNGNVWEYGSDWSGKYAEGAATDPQGPDSGSMRVMRGGSWVRDWDACRSGARASCLPDGRSDSIGFRVVVSAP